MLLREEDRLSRSLSLRYITRWDGHPLYYTLGRGKTVPKNALVVFPSVLEQTLSLEMGSHIALDNLWVFSWLPRPPQQSQHCNDFLRDALSFIRAIESQFHIPVKDMIFMGQAETVLIIKALLQDYALSPRAVIYLEPGLPKTLQPSSQTAKSLSVYKINNQPKDPLMMNDDYIKVLNGFQSMHKRLTQDVDSTLPNLTLNGGPGELRQVFARITEFTDQVLNRATTPVETCPAAVPFVRNQKISFLNRQLRRAKNLGVFSQEHMARLESDDFVAQADTQQAQFFHSLRVHANNEKLILAHLLSLCLSTGDYLTLTDVSTTNMHNCFKTITRFEPAAIGVSVLKNNEMELLEQQTYCMQQGLNQFQFHHVNVYDPEELRATGERSDIICAFGLVESILDEQTILRVLQTFNQLLNADGFLVFSNLPQHPVTERFLPKICGPEGGVFRSQRQLDKLLSWAGFSTNKIYLDQEGMFSVIVARRLNKRRKSQ